jgi:D-amino-acid dehydrogenase
MHVCVIGAGVVGLTTAYFLQAEGHSVVVVDRAYGPGAEASRGNGAQLSYSYVAPLADGSIPPKLPSLLLARDSPLKFHLRFERAQWSWGLEFLRHANSADARATTAALLPLAELSRDFIEPLIEGEAIDCNFTRGGKLVVYSDAAALDGARAQAEYQATLGSNKRVLDAEACVQQEPALTPYRKQIAGGVWSESDAAADSGMFCDRLRPLLERRGVELLFGRQVERFDLEGGNVRALQTADGASVRADAYVLAAGARATELAASAGLQLPIYPLKGYSITVRPIDAALPRASITDSRRKVVFAPLGDRVRVAGFVEVGGDPESIPPARIGALLAAAREVLGYHVVDGELQPWAGMRPATPSGRPILGRCAVSNLYLNVGHGMLGWTLAAGSARLVCDAIAGRTPTIDLAPFAYPSDRASTRRL